MKELILKLAAASGPAGSEKHVRELLAEQIQPFVDELRTDVLGNVIAHKKGTDPNRKTILLEANMDESGVMSIHVEENGFIRMVSIGDLKPSSLIGERIRFSNKVWGVVGAETGKALKDLTFADLFVDIGATSKTEAEQRLPIGTAGVIDKGAFELGKQRVAGKSLDNRAGCAVVIDVVSKLKEYPHDLTIVFAAQKEVGSRGIKAAAYQTEADFALVIGAARAGDMPKAESSSLKLGEGPAIKVMDKGIIVPSQVKQLLIDTAEKTGISYQLEISPTQTSDAGTILLTRDGIPTGAVSLPVRYAGTPSQVVDMRDVEQTSRLIFETLLAYH